MNATTWWSIYATVVFACAIGLWAWAWKIHRDTVTLLVKVRANLDEAKTTWLHIAGVAAALHLGEKVEPEEEPWYPQT